MQLFFSNNREGECFILDPEEVRHLLVLRQSIGDTIHITDGNGFIYQCALIELTKRICKAQITTSFSDRFPFKALSIYISPTKNMDRMEWMVEKLTEIGVGKIGFIKSDNSERREIKTDRLEKKAIAAMKQSLKGLLPEIIPMCSLKDFLKNNISGIKLIAHCYEDVVKKELSSIQKSNENITILIGPEGDFTQEEVFLTKQAGFEGISLGQSRLRTETAAIVACTLANSLILNDKI